MLKKYNLTKEIIDQLASRVTGNNRISSSYSNKVVPSKVKQNIYRTKGSLSRNYHGNSSYLGKEKRVLAVFTGTDVGVEESIKELNEAKKYGITFDIAVSESAEEILELDFLKEHLRPERTFTERDKLITEKVVEGVSGIIVPMTTQNTVAKLALGIQDTFISFALWQSLWHGKPVLIDFANAIQFRGSYSQQPMLQNIVEDYTNKLKKMGVKEVSGTDYVMELLKSLDIKEKINSSIGYIDNKKTYTNEENNSDEQKTVITEKDIIEMGNQGGELSIPRRAIVTPLAYDTAKKLGISIIKN